MSTIEAIESTASIETINPVRHHPNDGEQDQYYQCLLPHEPIKQPYSRFQGAKVRKRNEIPRPLTDN
jgi:hypothetical protein